MTKDIVLPGKARLTYDGNGILIITMLTKSVIDLAAARAIVEHSSEITEKALHCNLVDIREMNYMSSEAQGFLGNQNMVYIPAIALLMNSGVQKNLVNLYFRFSNPLIPTRAFITKERALEWLRSKLKEVRDLIE